MVAYLSLSPENIPSRPGVLLSQTIRCNPQVAMHASTTSEKVAMSTCFQRPRITHTGIHTDRDTPRLPGDDRRPGWDSRREVAGGPVGMRALLPMTTMTNELNCNYFRDRTPAGEFSSWGVAVAPEHPIQHVKVAVVPEHPIQHVKVLAAENVPLAVVAVLRVTGAQQEYCRCSVVVLS
eukprot:8285125-Pyramimonas_sp.AAC.1